MPGGSEDDDPFDMQQCVDPDQLLDDIKQDKLEEHSHTEPKLHSARWYALRKEQALFQVVLLFML